ncbi:Hypothetical protein I595_3690 [Croceitalea dokdonensis DOKDO 023]|uniref:SHOCT domain-containing protein n=1 Tax=Croceitalea dokdonensis DOKDO 023 TaxID=1300341 RepID=A0A0P7AAW5_9FLAO|nr:hypothetical protein [Croceitalea dokdonensis]KPM30213.1 Hypothetical protein I595_3690 [Croceitalea dokdonensis DOKDO 023]
MNTQIGVGLLVGAVTGTSIYIWNSDNFTKPQKIILLFCIVFPPAQWILAIILFFYNSSVKPSLNVNLNSSSKESTPKTKKQGLSTTEQKQSVEILKEKGLLNESEYQEKIDIIEKQIKIDKIYKSKEYLNLKSLFESGLFTKDEFENKVELLKTKASENNSFIQSDFVREKLIGIWKDNVGTIEFWDDNTFVFNDKNKDITNGSWSVDNSDIIEIRFNSRLEKFYILELSEKTLSYEHNNSRFTLKKENLI